ncbi:hypothetical protein CSV61_16115 [Sporosarcina sp. P3]|uniref:DUF6173 family protein n=1 Tax=Sporosarcina sp. P3 TaxID=2048245 RepID=UPI000C167C71|nr:DUF6173 family protein [Sporosarcina sp. P3]PID20173.1 hypothetical protein CSV61_16115 [Sporosarcina sp. P3]
MYQGIDFQSVQKDLSDTRKADMAEGYYERLVELINDFDGELDQAHEVGMRLVSFGQTVQFHVEDLGFYNPGLIIFHGVQASGEKVQLMQHISQISFLLTAVKRLNPEQPKKRIGFNTQG